MQYRYLNELKKLHNNPRQIRDDDFDKLCESIKNNANYFEARPIILSNRTGELVIIAGNMRYEASLKLGLEKVPTFLLENLTIEQEREIIIRDNVNNGEWDFDILLADYDVDELTNWGVELPDDLLTDDDIDDIIDNIDTDEDEIPDLPKNNITKRGDIWQLGKHRLMCGDSTSIDDVGKLMNGDKADMVFTDPPYRMETGGGNKFKRFHNTMKSIEHLCNFNPVEFLNVLSTSIFYTCNNQQKNIMNAYIFCNKDLIPDYLNWSIQNGYSFNILVWKKNNAMPLGGTHRPDIEYLLHFRQNSIWNTNLKDVNYSKCLEYDKFSYQKKQNEAGGHPTPKPVELIIDEILISSNKNSIVVDLFAGSGSTLIACEKTQRINYGMELDEKYCDVIIKRWQQLTNKDAVLISNNKIFNELKDE